MGSKIKIEDIKQQIEEQGWKLISQEYSNLQTEMNFECPEGHQVFSSWGKIRNKFICPICQSNSLIKQDGTIIPKSVGTKRILALDQASYTTGYSIFDNGKLIKFGIFTATQDNEIARFNAIKNWLLLMINNWKPDYIGIEGIQFQEGIDGQKIDNKIGVTVFQMLAQLQGILMETCYEQKIPYEICSPGIWRQACGVKGRTRTDKKRSMQILAKQWHDVTVTNDEADAIGIGHYLANMVQKNVTIENWE